MSIILICIGKTSAVTAVPQLAIATTWTSLSGATAKRILFCRIITQIIWDCRMFLLSLNWLEPPTKNTGARIRILVLYSLDSLILADKDSWGRNIFVHLILEQVVCTGFFSYSAQGENRMKLLINTVLFN